MHKKLTKHQNWNGREPLYAHACVGTEMSSVDQTAYRITEITIF